jgi:hypothetical protein
VVSVRVAQSLTNHFQIKRTFPPTNRFRGRGDLRIAGTDPDKSQSGNGIESVDSFGGEGMTAQPEALETREAVEFLKALIRDCRVDEVEFGEARECGEEGNHGVSDARHCFELESFEAGQSRDRSELWAGHLEVDKSQSLEGVEPGDGDKGTPRQIPSIDGKVSQAGELLQRIKLDITTKREANLYHADVVEQVNRQCISELAKGAARAVMTFDRLRIPDFGGELAVDDFVEPAGGRFGVG